MARPPIPGTHEPGFVEHTLKELGNHPLYKEHRRRLKATGARGIKYFQMGECRIIMAREPAGIDGEMLWHLSISCPDRHPTWDEIKTARYRLLDDRICFGMLLPQPEYYVNIEQQDHTFHLWEVTDPREPWSGR